MYVFKISLTRKKYAFLVLLSIQDKIYGAYNLLTVILIHKENSDKVYARRDQSIERAGPYGYGPLVRRSTSPKAH
jgi:hypothetical protein